MSLVTRKPVFGVSDIVRHKPACAATIASKRLESSDIKTRGIILSRQRTTKVLIRLRGCAGRSALLLFAYILNRFSHDVAQMDQGNVLFSHIYIASLQGKPILGLQVSDYSTKMVLSAHLNRKLIGELIV